MRFTNRRNTLFATRCLTPFAAALLLVPAMLWSAEGDKKEGKEGKGHQEGWVHLLEGEGFSKHWTTTGNWKAEEGGVVHLEPRPGESGWTRYDAYLWLKDKQYKDFEIEFDYKVAKGGNSGFYFHVGDMKDPVAKGIEVQIYDAPAKAGGKLTDHDSGGIIPGFAPTKATAKPAGEWNHFSIAVKGSKVTVALNGETVNEVDLTHEKLKNRPETGSVGFQDHGMPLWLKDIRIREL